VKKMGVYTVRLYLEVRFDVNVIAETPGEAASKAINENDLYELARSGGEYAEDIHGVIVDRCDERGNLLETHDIESF